ncbi:SGNH hydrolase-type esterase domain-containing protein [Podospora conica]|nr:SGNH hydrolase-type esterase domain-containing protein [Schizothecium conicum]
MMFGRQPLAALVASVLVLSQAAVALPALQNEELGNTLSPRDGEKWVAAWTSMPQLVESNNMPPAPFGNNPVLKDATIRQTLQMTLRAERIRIQITNTMGGADLPITSATVALTASNKAGSASIDATTLQPLTFNGSPSIKIPKGQTAYSDPLPFPIRPQTSITISLHSQPGQPSTSITGHPGSRTTSWLAAGNRVRDATFTGTSTKHWYFLSAVEALLPSPPHGTLVILGDSITDGRGSTDDANNRWPDLLLARLLRANLTHVGVANQAAGGNTVLSGGLGPPLLQRYKRDALEVQGARWAMLFIGVNDIGNSGNPSGTATQLQNAFKQVVADLKKAGIKTIGATITPFNGNGQAYSSAARDQARQSFNAWILGGQAGFDVVVDFAKATADPGNKSVLASKFDGGDHLHPNVAGFQAMADVFPLEVLAA